MCSGIMPSIFSLVSLHGFALTNLPTKINNQVLYFSNHPVPRQVYDTLNFDDHIAQRSVSVIYLGIIFDEQLNFKLHINARDKIAKGIGMISMCCYFMPRNCLISVHNSFVLPYLMYCIEIRG